MSSAQDAFLSAGRSAMAGSDPERTGLARSLGLAHAVLYGLGITIGAGIYVLVGLAAGRAGVHAPIAFLLAAAVMAFSAATFAELGTRLPVAASESAHARYEANTQEALQAEVFGAPWYIFDGVPFWGQDRLDFLERAFAAAKPG